ncbi:MAG: VOC family protein, partial [Rhodospirillales bacterium]|nr:VOC family protein [Acetobacter sp.]
MNPNFRGLHHVTAVTADARPNLDFYTRVLGMRLVKKTVNQDDVSAYHLFYADADGQPGTELTFFEWAHVPPARAGAGAVTETALRVRGGVDTLAAWTTHFDQHGVAHGAVEDWAGLPSLAFTDPEGQRLRLIAEPAADHDGLRALNPWKGSPLPPEQSVVGLG